MGSARDLQDPGAEIEDLSGYTAPRVHDRVDRAIHVFHKKQKVISVLLRAAEAN